MLLFVISDSPQKDSRLVTTTRSKHNCASHIRYNRLLDSKDLSQEKNLCFSGTNQKPERRRPFGTGLVKHCAQGLFWPFFTFLRAIFFRPFRLSLAPTICPWVSEDELTSNSGRDTTYFAEIKLLMRTKTV